jgi:hypothetical protein
LGACLLAAITYFPLFSALTLAANPALSRAIVAAPVIVVADKTECSFQFDPIGNAKFNTSCDIIKSYLARAGVNYKVAAASTGALAELHVGNDVLRSFHGENLSASDLHLRRNAWESDASHLLVTAGYPTKADPSKVNVAFVILILIAIIVPSAMVYGPMAALLAELFPAKVRYTSLGVPYHLGTGWFGGFLPATAFAIVAATGNMYSGLWYPLVGALATFIIGLIMLPETRGADLSQ